MKVKVGDIVKVIAGADKGKSGKVIRTIKKDNKVVVEGIHIVKKHSKPTNTNDQGGIFEIEAPIHVSNVSVIDEAVAKEMEKEATKKAKEEQKATKAKKEEVKKEAPKKASKKASK